MIRVGVLSDIPVMVKDFDIDCCCQDQIEIRYRGLAVRSTAGSTNRCSVFPRLTIEQDRECLQGIQQCKALGIVVQ